MTVLSHVPIGDITPNDARIALSTFGCVGRPQRQVEAPQERLGGGYISRSPNAWSHARYV